MEKIKLEIVGMSYSQSQSGAYALILGETGGKRRLPIIIGGFEAQAIAIELEKMKPARPLTHDLFKKLAFAFEINVTEVIINKFAESVFYARLVCNNGEKEIEIDSRTSDAVAIALRFNCPIYTYEKIMAAAGVVMQDDETKVLDPLEPTPESDDETELTYLTLSELDTELQKAIDSEEYEKASRIRDEINRRKEK